jgi:hypothetical protein
MLKEENICNLHKVKSRFSSHKNTSFKVFIKDQNLNRKISKIYRKGNKDVSRA